MKARIIQNQIKKFLRIYMIFFKWDSGDFRLVGATTRRPDEIPEAVRSRCVEVFFSALKREDVEE